MKQKYFLTAAIVFLAGIAGAADAPATESGAGLSSVLIAVNAVLLIVVVVLLAVLSNAVQKLKAGNDGKVHLSWWDRFAALKSEKSEEELTLDEDFDGISELDNPTPPWFNFIFYTTIIVAVLYLLNYHILKTGKLQDAEYTTAVEESKAEVSAYLAKAGNLVDENNVELSTDAKVIEQGATLFKEKCAVCHVADGGGNVGPNLTDNYWLYGGSVKSIFKTIKYGTSKGMPAWQTSFTGVQIKALASFVKSLKGTTPAKAKEPQGELYQEEGAPAAPADSTASASADSTKVN